MYSKNYSIENAKASTHKRASRNSHECPRATSKLRFLVSVCFYEWKNYDYCDDDVVFMSERSENEKIVRINKRGEENGLFSADGDAIGGAIP